ncbi:hypothetical protein TCDM_00268 [Trypanosoma cruzi Dm28c]|uniref:Mitochondrial import inner membrane translocase subunit TIM50 n=2 Tax=Trypanosoma cruzi TaxID=5693 RepID=V5BX67_TRYCR|nr:hypothetical protein TCDM_00268 [Trypanosoma cruzi Dm28c]PWU95203.1 hypothetical protein C4B63_23g189 [Trypanosoma cruzi]
MSDRTHARLFASGLPLTSQCNTSSERATTAYISVPSHISERFASVSTSLVSGNRSSIRKQGHASEGSVRRVPLRLTNLTTGGNISGRQGFTLNPSMPAENSLKSYIFSRGSLSKRLLSTPDSNNLSSSLSLSHAPSNARLVRARAPAGAADGFFIPPVRAVDEGKLVVVLDLDETLVYSRSGRIILRPGVNRLFDVLRGRCETVVWTAGEKSYAMEVLQLIDPSHCVQHCIYRHEKWWTERPGYVKDIAALGRPLHQTIIIDNTPDCLRAHTRNALLVRDFRGPCGGSSRFDNTLFVLADIIDDVLNGPEISIDAFHDHPQLQLRSVECESGSTIDVLTLKQDNFLDPPKGNNVIPYNTQRVSRRRTMVGM